MVSSKVIVTVLSAILSWLVLATVFGAWGTSHADIVLQFVILVTISLSAGALVVEGEFKESS